MQITISQAETEYTPGSTAICANRELVASVRRGESVTFEVAADYVEIDVFCSTAQDMVKVVQDTHLELTWDSVKHRLYLTPKEA